jgi:LmbE family N-acetylglucosaminyl deacetylase
MRTLLLAPHSDDEILFAAYTIARHECQVAIVARDPDEGIAEVRLMESTKAVGQMARRASVRYLGHVEGAISEPRLRKDLERFLPDNDDSFDPLVAQAGGYTEPVHVFAPVVEDDGHDEHNLVGRLAVEVFGLGSVTAYPTYTRHGGRTTDVGREVPIENEWIIQKFWALSCFKSQIAHPARRPWFYDLLDMREWYA